MDRQLNWIVTATRIVLCGYVGAVIVLHALGAGDLAAYATMPAWLVVSPITESIERTGAQGQHTTFVFSNAGNLTALVISAIVNAVPLYLIVMLSCRAYRDG
jgi:hypothetical protein